jgi:hypothetical protein
MNTEKSTNQVTKVSELKHKISLFKEIKSNKSPIVAFDYICFSEGFIVFSNLTTQIATECLCYTGKGFIEYKFLLDILKICKKNDTIHFDFESNKVIINDTPCYNIPSNVSVEDYPRIILADFVNNELPLLHSTDYNFTPFSAYLSTDKSYLSREWQKNILYTPSETFATNAQILKFLPNNYQGDTLLLPRLYSKLSGSFDFYKSNKHLFCVYNSEIIIASLIVNEQFPNIRSVIPTNNPNSFEVNTQELINAIKQVSVACNKYTNKISLTICNGLFTISAINIDENQEASTNLQIKTNDLLNDLTLNFNYKSLLDVIDSSQTHFVEYSASDRAVVLNRSSLIMPIK